MQSLISPVDHESRTNSYHADNEPIQSESEETPLLYNFPRTRDITHLIILTIMVGFLMVILLTGVAIGIYLLILQNNSENILPPVPNTFHLVTQQQWDPNLKSSETFKNVIIKQTDTKQCWEVDVCIQLIKDMKRAAGANNYLPYNFLVSDGYVYENIGWKYSPAPDLTGLVVAFIGNFTHVPPTAEQMITAKNLIAAAVNWGKLDNNFTIIGKSSKVVPKYLFRCLKSSPKWNKKLSDV